MQRLETIALAAALLVTTLAASPQASPLPPAAAPAQGAVTPAPAPTPSPDPVLTARSKMLYHALATGTLDRTQLTAAAASQLTADLTKAIAAKIAPLGDPVSIDQVKIVRQGDSTLYGYVLAFADGTRLDFIVGYDAAGKVSALALSPAQ